MYEELNGFNPRLPYQLVVREATFLYGEAILSEVYNLSVGKTMQICLYLKCVIFGSGFSRTLEVIWVELNGELKNFNVMYRGMRAADPS
jgi:hypothetical protein